MKNKNMSLGQNTFFYKYTESPLKHETRGCPSSQSINIVQSLNFKEWLSSKPLNSGFADVFSLQQAPKVILTSSKMFFGLSVDFPLILPVNYQYSDGCSDTLSQHNNRRTDARIKSGMSILKYIL